MAAAIHVRTRFVISATSLTANPRDRNQLLASVHPAGYAMQMTDPQQ
jgi:hypothetical protein